MKVLLTRRVPDPAIRMLQEHFTVQVASEMEPLPEDKLLQVVRGADAILALADSKITAEVMDAAGAQLKVIADYGVGYDNVDLAAAIERNIYVTNTPNVENNVVADYTFALMLALMRHIVPGDRFLREGRFTHWDAYHFLGPELEGATLGIVGLGRIGSTVARRAKGFEMKIIYYDKLRKEGLESAIGVKFHSYREVLSQSDIVTFHVPLTPETAGMMDADQFALMKPSAYLINASRGKVVREAALVSALKSRQIAGAALDVYEHEPHVSQELLKMDNVVLMPHLGSSTHRAREGMGRVAAQAIIAALSGEVPDNLVEGTT
ncbi:MAG: D-glycerate dehydrogenase [Chloroflexi bacterium]|nr:D-glycerate dehydrogenase [Chloroflexota bacterium]